MPACILYRMHPWNVLLRDFLDVGSYSISSHPSKLFYYYYLVISTITILPYLVTYFPVSCKVGVHIPMYNGVNIRVLSLGSRSLCKYYSQLETLYMQQILVHSKIVTFWLHVPTHILLCTLDNISHIKVILYSCLVHPEIPIKY